MSRRWISGAAGLALAASGLLAVTSSTGASAASAATSLTPAQCTALLTHTEPSVARTQIDSAAVVAQAGATPEHCLVTGTVENKAGGLASFSVSLPTAGYDGRLYFSGCGGACGYVAPPNPTWLSAGHAVATTDMVKHSLGALSFDWARNNREAEIDFGYRATHEATVIAKNLIKAAYGQRPEWSYFNGGSTGGRQALVAAQRYPHDYDGIIARMPASNETSVGTLHLVWTALANLDSSGDPILVNEDMPVLHEAALDRCDHIDGLVDGLIEDPRNCDFKASMSPLSPAKAAAAQRIYDGPSNSTGDRLTPAAPMPGSELNWRNNYIQGPSDASSTYYQFGESFTRNAAYEQDLPLSWRPEDFDFDSDPAGLGFMEQFYTGTNTDMSTFQRAGGKMMLFQGWADQSVLPGFTTDYYERLVQQMGAKTTSEFARLFMVPGLGHAAVPLDPNPAIEDWTERDIAPAQVNAINMTGATQGADRPLYPYPLVSRWSGKGDVNDPSTWGPHDPTKNVVATAPSQVRNLKVTGKTKARARTVKWVKPRSDGGAAVSKYKIVIKQKGRAKITRSIASSKTKMTFKVRTLRRGKAVVSVTAINSAGSSKAATKNFRITR